MPSDPTGVSPKGLLARAAPDWFDDNLAVAGKFFDQNYPVSNNHFWTIALFNNATAGTVLKVYGITTSCDGGQGTGFYWNRGTLGTAGPVAAPLRPDYPNPFGAIYTQDSGAVGSVPNTFSLGTLISTIATSGFDGSTVVSPYPLALITPSSEQRITSTFGNLPYSDAVWLDMHPQDATARQLTEGMLVRVWNDLGEVHLRVKITADVRPGVVCSPKGAWMRTSDNGQTVSALAPAHYADLNDGACFNDARVEVAALA